MTSAYSRYQLSAISPQFLVSAFSWCLVVHDGPCARTRSVSFGGAAAAEVGGSGESGCLSAGTVLDRQGVSVAEGVLGGDHFVAEGGEVGADVPWDALLDHEQVGDDVAEARRGDRLLYVHIEVEHVGDHLRRRLLDGAPARGSERD